MRCAILLLLSILGSASCNVALHKPVFASSFYPGSPSHAPGNVVDVYAEPCYSSDHYDWNPWLVIDLVDTFLVNSVAITIRESYGYRAHDFKIELFDVNPVHCTNVVGRLCLQHDGLMKSSGTLVCHQDVQGRFLKFSKNHLFDAFDTLEACELEVFGTESSVENQYTGKPWTRFTRNPGVELRQTWPVAPVILSLLDCATHCAHNQSCVEFNYGPAPGTCQVIVRPTSNYMYTVHAVASSDYYCLC